VTVPLGELLAVVAEQQPVVQHLRERTVERARNAPVHLLVRPVVGAADDVGDVERQIVGDRGELVGGAAVGAGQRDSAEAHGSVVVAHGTVLQNPRKRLGIHI
jgi:hypothetical protein